MNKKLSYTGVNVHNNSDTLAFFVEWIYLRNVLTVQPVINYLKRHYLLDRKISKKVIRLLREHYGFVKPDLKYINIYQLTIAVVLSARTTDKQVNSVTTELFKQYPDFESMSGAGLLEVETIIKSTGFYRNKSKNIIQLSKQVTGQYGGTVPDNLQSLVKLAGIGRKSANVILSMGYNIPALAVDTHVARIAKRLGYTESDDPVKIENDLTAIIPESDWIDTHLILIRHGRSLCKARKPACNDCPVISFCPGAYTYL